MLCLLYHLYIYVITCAYSHIVYTKNQQKLLIFLKPKKPRKNTIKPKKPNPYPIKGQTYNDDDRDRLRSLVAPPDYYNSQRTTLDLGSMRAVSYDAKSLKCTLSTVSPSFKRSFFYRVHCPFIMESPSYRDKRGECSL